MNLVIILISRNGFYFTILQVTIKSSMLMDFSGFLTHEFTSPRTYKQATNCNIVIPELTSYPQNYFPTTQQNPDNPPKKLR